MDLALDPPNWWRGASPTPSLMELKKITHYATDYTEKQFILFYPVFFP
jgi:hypothetical protein